MPSLMPLFDRVADAQERFSKLSLSQISAQLEREVLRILKVVHIHYKASVRYYAVKG